ncbi:hypothetical protein PENANT_c002G07576 [Penicillium antarcticum]|uniref:Uncharacterized protein n=1 Tax=Penicillium antarcticum TaxID=416450 RepID=A0A1V6QKM8_9EURO|nr:uncharacterized protein N7508_008396 [Penicillium antarcticum]KAJ5293575.1 hypothetical protein N7508_008396 [Penicillium antarcticum]OQD89794.1 hypothetical protein PENANT_c002G07576 [Penicillium antarcticum]
MAQENQVAPEFVYHVILMMSQSKGSSGQNEKIRILGTYTSVGKAKDAAHRSLFESGYERAWFSTFETNPEVLEEFSVCQGVGLALYAIATDGTVFRVRITTSPNTLRLTTDNEDGRIPISLYYVVQTNVPYCTHERKPAHDTNVEGMFKSYAEARKFASTLLLSEEDGITVSSYKDYCEAGPNEKDCEYGDNVIVHAIGESGENYFVSVVMCQELESVRLAEASFRMS